MKEIGELEREISGHIGVVSRCLELEAESKSNFRSFDLIVVSCVHLILRALGLKRYCHDRPVLLYTKPAN